ncbi:MAG: hypothetical protein HW421_926 [Ignavibacteria bacterium]|nr:hypothetical protein [Ignavibacteria bacterium]
MKKLIILLIMICSSFSLFAQEPVVKFYMDDGSYKVYNINDIDSINLIKSNSNYVMKIFYQAIQVAYYPTEVISKIQFEKDSQGNKLLNVYVYGYPKSYKLSEVDSIYFYIDVYQPLSIGSQVWMLNNLNLDYYRNENPIPEVTNDTLWSKLTTGAWCYYNNNPANGIIYGKLYNWYCVNDSRGLAPAGWHVASDAEWKTLEIYLGLQRDGADVDGWRGEYVGSKLKEVGKTHWLTDESSTNESGFTALPGGCRQSDGIFYNYGISYFSYWWTSRERNDSNASYRSLSYGSPYIQRGKAYKKYGFSVRCIMGNESKAPIISRISPTSASIGNIITINGTGFGSLQGSSFVSFDSLKASQYISWSETQLKVQVPIGAKTCKVSVNVNEKKSNEFDLVLAYDLPVIIKINLPTAYINDIITLTGSGFGTKQGSGFVTFNSATATQYISWGYYQIMVKVPVGAKSGKVYVTVNGIKSNEVDFIVNREEDPTNVVMVLIPAGTFKMGNTGNYSGYSNWTQNEYIVHNVTISKDFYMSMYEITQNQYEGITGKNPSWTKGGNLPVNLSWYGAIDYCNKLSEKEGFQPCYSGSGTSTVCDWNANGYRLPTEAEWEYACKAGTETDIYNGNLGIATWSKCTPIDTNLDRIAWYCGNSGSKIHEVGQKEPNAFGLYDMLGNVLEYCWDWVSGTNYTDSLVTDPKGPDTFVPYKEGPNMPDHVLRGGDKGDNPFLCRSSFRFIAWDTFLFEAYGFRVVRKK